MAQKRLFFIFRDEEQRNKAEDEENDQREDRCSHIARRSLYITKNDHTEHDSYFLGDIEKAKEEVVDMPF